jgi:DNA-binding response OmpR family regulator
MIKRIVVVENDPAITEVLTIILQGEQYRVECFDNTSFIDGLVHDMPGLILLDMWLSGLNGKDVCLQLKENTVYKHIPVIIMSANQDVKLHAEEACADDYLSKPFDINDLLLIVKKHMK